MSILVSFQDMEMDKKVRKLQVYFFIVFIINFLGNFAAQISPNFLLSEEQIFWYFLLFNDNFLLIGQMTQVYRSDWFTTKKS